MSLIQQPLGNCDLKISDELVKGVSNGIYEGTPNSIDILSVVGQIHYNMIFFPLGTSSKTYNRSSAKLEEKPFDCSTLYVLITLQAPNSGLPSSVKLANIFGYDSQEHHLKYINLDVAKSFISKEIANLEIEETVVVTVRKAVRKIFDISKAGSLIDNESNKQECFKIVRSFIKDYYDMKNNVVEMDYAFENKIYEITSIKNPQEIGNQKSYGIARIKIIYNIIIQTHLRIKTNKAITKVLDKEIGELLELIQAIELDRYFTLCEKTIKSNDFSSSFA
ncbi:hypothetical protein C2G38_2211211 [Gigaspora rosea]|uniref:Uncharacterized protein n=1 Tax=Gigaspora rosea TaxID=44941 RepID=A0A397UEK8_9GLOM|nr:hypothetical protein C2G38_2211211 [Gigaspora rosea]